MIAYWVLFLVFASGALWFSAGQRPLWAVAGPASRPAPDLQSSRRPGGLILLWASLAVAFMIGLRFEVGADWPSYLEIFRFIEDDDLISALTRIDPGYALVNWLAGKARMEIWVVNLVCGLLFMYGLLRFARLQPNPWLAIVVAIPYLIIVVAMGYTRQAVAIALSLVALVAVIKGSFNRFILWVLFGALFHRTAVIMIPIVALAFTRNRFQAVVIGVVGCIVGYYLLTSAQGLEHFQRMYVSRRYEAQGALVRLAMNVPPALIFLGLARRLTENDLERRIWRNFAWIAIISFAAWLFIESTAALDRMALYMIPLQIFVLARVPYLFSPGRASGLLVVAIVLYSALIQFVWLNYSTHAVAWIPYNFYSFAPFG